MWPNECWGAALQKSPTRKILKPYFFLSFSGASFLGKNAGKKDFLLDLTQTPLPQFFLDAEFHLSCSRFPAVMLHTFIPKCFGIRAAVLRSFVIRLGIREAGVRVVAACSVLSSRWLKKAERGEGRSGNSIRRLSVKILQLVLSGVEIRIFGTQAQLFFKKILKNNLQKFV